MTIEVEDLVKALATAVFAVLAWLVSRKVDSIDKRQDDCDRRAADLDKRVALLEARKE